MLAALLLVPAIAAAPMQARASFGGEQAGEFHGVFDLGLRKGALSAELLTDTLDLRWAPEGDRGRAWVALRAEAGAAGLLISPWTDGAPDPSRSLIASTLGPEAGVVAYLSSGFWVGGAAGARAWSLQAAADRVEPAPNGRVVLTYDALAGWWSPSAQAWLRAGADASPGLAPSSPHAHFTAAGRPEWAVAPLAALRLGAASGQDALTRTRVGGLNPYVVPLAGAGWAELWVEDYAALRAGPSLRAGPWGVDAFADLVVVGGAEPGTTTLDDGRLLVGLGGHLRWQGARGFAEVDAGAAPGLPRQADVARVGVWARAGWDWGPVGRGGAAL